MAVRIQFTSDKIVLAGLWQPNSTETAAIICHPHPQFGGDMHNPMVTAAANAYAARNISTLRFNFRTVGNGTGTDDSGNGEQKDVHAAIAWLNDQGVNQIHLCGYSFGAWISALVVANGAGVSDMIMIAPPLALIKFPNPLSLPPLSLVITGARDDIAPAAMIQTRLNRWNPCARLEILPHTDHFFVNAMTDLQSVMEKHLTIS